MEQHSRYNKRKASTGSLCCRTLVSHQMLTLSSSAVWRRGGERRLAVLLSQNPLPAALIYDRRVQRKHFSTRDGLPLMPGNERSQLLHSKPSPTHSLIISVALNTERKNKRPSEFLQQMEVQGDKSYATSLITKEIRFWSPGSSPPPVLQVLCN